MNDSECPGGFCHDADCRLDPDDHSSIQEGVCASGPVEGWCSTTSYRPCTSDASCTLAACPYCAPGETCISKKRPCFLNGGIVRQGTPRTPEGASAGIYCIQGDKEAVNLAAGFPVRPRSRSPSYSSSCPSRRLLKKGHLRRCSVARLCGVAPLRLRARSVAPSI